MPSILTLPRGGEVEDSWNVSHGMLQNFGEITCHISYNHSQPKQKMIDSANLFVVQFWPLYEVNCALIYICSLLKEPVKDHRMKVLYIRNGLEIQMIVDSIQLYVCIVPTKLYSQSISMKITMLNDWWLWLNMPQEKYRMGMRVVKDRQY